MQCPLQLTHSFPRLRPLTTFRFPQFFLPIPLLHYHMYPGSLSSTLWLHCICIPVIDSAWFTLCARRLVPYPIHTLCYGFNPLPPYNDIYFQNGYEQRMRIDPYPASAIASRHQHRGLIGLSVIAVAKNTV